MAHHGGIHQNYSMLTVQAKAGNELFNSTKGQERIGHRHGFRILYPGSGGNQTLDVSSLGVSMANHNLSDLPATCHWRQGRLVAIFWLNHELVGLQCTGSG